MLEFLIMCVVLIAALCAGVAIRVVVEMFTEDDEWL